MGIELEEVSIPIKKERASNATVAKDREDMRTYKLADLPFPPYSGRANIKLWRSRFLPLVYDWAGALTSPFASNSHPDFSNTVKNAWDRVYLSLVDRHDHPAILPVVCSRVDGA
jgi:hypothetical protein